MSLGYKEIQELIKLINKSNLTEFKMKNGDFQLSIRTKKYGKGRQVISPPQQILPIQAPMPQMQQSYVPPPAAPKPPPVSEAAPSDGQAESTAEASEKNNYIEIRSPIVGTFYRSASPEKPPYIKVGDTVNVGDVVCIVEAMKLFNEIESEVSGTVVKVLIEDAQPVEYDQVLYLVEAN